MALCGKRAMKVQQDTLNLFPLPSPPNEMIGKIESNKGGGNFQITYLDIDTNPKTALVSMPSKFKNTVWVKKGTYIIFECEPESNSKILGEILHILSPKQIKHIQNNNQWPENL